MEIALQKQRQSVKRQVQSAQQDENGWFTTGWSSDVPLAKPTPPAQQTAPQTDGNTNPPPIPAKTAAFCSPIKPIELDSAIRTAASREGYSADLLKAVIKQESAFDPCAISSKGAMGLMQLMPTTASQLGVADPFDPNENLNGGAKYLGQLLSRYNGDVKLALGAYNAGPTRVDQFGDVPPIPETQNYVRAILSALNIGQ